MQIIESQFIAVMAEHNQFLLKMISHHQFTQVEADCDKECQKPERYREYGQARAIASGDLKTGARSNKRRQTWK